MWEIPKKNGQFSNAICVQFPAIDVLCVTFTKFYYHKKFDTKKGRIIVKSDSLFIRPRTKVKKNTIQDLY